MLDSTAGFITRFGRLSQLHRDARKSGVGKQYRITHRSPHAKMARISRRQLADILESFMTRRNREITVVPIYESTVGHNGNSFSSESRKYAFVFERPGWLLPVNRRLVTKRFEEATSLFSPTFLHGDPECAHVSDTALLGMLHPNPGLLLI